MGGKVGENPAALRATVFFAILEKPEGVFKRPPPPSRARVNSHVVSFSIHVYIWWQRWDAALSVLQSDHI